MPTEGPESPSAMTNDSASSGWSAWTNPDNAKTSNNTYAVFSADSAGRSYYLKATDFGFSIPDGSTIDGIKLEVEM